MKKHSFLTLLVTLLITFPGFSQQTKSLSHPDYKGAVIEIENPHSLSKKSLLLDQDWDFYWGRFIDESDFSKADLTIKPNTWNHYPLPADIHEIAKTGKGSGTFRVLIKGLLPKTEYAFRTYSLTSTASKIIINNEIVLFSGYPSEDWTETRPNTVMGLATFKSDRNGEALITIYVSNKDYRNGGIWNAPEIGERILEEKKYNQSAGSLCILTGLLLAVVLYGICLFIVKKDKASISLSIFTLTILIRMISADFAILKQILPGIPFGVIMKLEYSALFLSPIFYGIYLYNLDEAIFGKFKIKYPVIAGAVLGLVVFAAPLTISSRLVSTMQIYLGIFAMIELVCLIIYTIKYHNYIGILCIVTIVVIILSALNDIIYTSTGIGIHVFESKLLPFGFAIFTICQTIILAILQTRSEKKVQDLYNYLSKTNKAYDRFIPKQILELLNRKNITELQIGEKITREMMILSADIRNFTATSENMTGLQVFDFLNSYFNEIAPIIQEHGGIIEKYLGDGITVFFPKKCEAALICALKIQEKVVELRKTFSEKGLPELKIGIGVHYGKVLIGTAGDASRMSEVSISKELSVLQHVESATKRYKKSIIVTKEAIAAAAKEAKVNNLKFNFYGKRIPEALGHELYYIYNEHMEKDL